MTATRLTLDGNEAVARIAHRTNEVIAIYPITPSSPMGESADAWSAEKHTNLWGVVPSVVEMQSEGGAAGALHGALQTGALATTFTASQGLLLMIPNMYKIAGELTPTVIHVAARSLAAQGLSIFGDHSDVMAARATGFALLASSNVQEAHDLALVAQAATLETRVPFLHFFDGFRTSHEVTKIELIEDDVVRLFVRDELVAAHRARALSPDHPVLRGTAQNPDVYFQAREAANRFYLACPDHVAQLLDRLAEFTGRKYGLFDYAGAPDAERVLVLMGSGAEAARATVETLVAQGEKVGVVTVRLFRPFSAERLVAVLPASARAIAVLDRTKEPGSLGEPLYLDVVAALAEAGPVKFGQRLPRIVGGRYGLSSKEFTPAMIRGVLTELGRPEPKNHFTIGIQDDVTGTSLDYDPAFSIEGDDVVRAVFYGLGSDGTVGANKNSIKIIGEETDQHVQAYFVYDSKKAGAVTISHLRFGPKPIRAPYLIDEAQFVACHQPQFLERFDVTRQLGPGGVFLLNTPHPVDKVWDTLPRLVQERLLKRKAKLFVIDASRVARDVGIGARINTVMQTAFFAISGVLPRDKALEAIKHFIEKSYGKQGSEVVRKNLAAVDHTLEELHEVPLPGRATATHDLVPPVPGQAPEFVRQVLGAMIAGRGDELPVSVLPCDGTFPTATAQWEKRSLAHEIPLWDPQICIQCGKCALVCPHGVIRTKVAEPAALANAPEGFHHAPARDKEWAGLDFVLLASPEDCTGCAICVDVCPVRNKSQARLKAINMSPLAPVVEAERAHWDYFLELPEFDRRRLNPTSLHQQQIQRPLFEFSGACAGCGETPYVKLLSQLFGDRLLVANATGCSSIYGGNLPTTPWAQDEHGRGPTWSNSLFEDNAEFGLGFRLALDYQRELAGQLVRELAGELGGELVDGLLQAGQHDEAGIYEQRERVSALKARLARLTQPAARRLEAVADMLVRKSVWIVGGDGWAYDIGFGGLDHVLASGRDVNVLVLDTEVYSNTGGQMSKSTPKGAVAKFAAAGKPLGKKDLGLMAMTYGHVYVARVAMGARDEQTLRAFLEAEAYPGPSLIIAYSHCIAHGINMTLGLREQQAAVDCGQWPLYRYHPDRALAGEAPLKLDSKPPKIPLADYLSRENRFQLLTKTQPQRAAALMAEAQAEVHERRRFYEHLAQYVPATPASEAPTPAPPGGNGSRAAAAAAPAAATKSGG